MSFDQRAEPISLLAFHLDLELPITEAVRPNIEKTLLKGDRFPTHVDLIVGMDEDFISPQFPK
jgi:hypothetical protein